MAKDSHPRPIRIVRAESDIPFPPGAERIHSIRWVGDSGPPRWLWTVPTKKPLSGNGCLAWFYRRGVLKAPELPARYTVGIVAPCPSCGASGEDGDGCRNHGQRGITYELVEVDRNAPLESVTAKSVPLRTWEEFAAARRAAWQRRAQIRYDARRLPRSKVLPGVGVIELARRITEALPVRLVGRSQAVKDVRALAKSIQDRARGEIRRDGGGIITTARKIERLLEQEMTGRPKKVRAAMTAAAETARQIAEKYSRKG